MVCGVVALHFMVHVLGRSLVLSLVGSVGGRFCFWVCFMVWGCCVLGLGVRLWLCVPGDFCPRGRLAVCGVVGSAGSLGGCVVWAGAACAGVWWVLSWCVVGLS